MKWPRPCDCWAARPATRWIAGSKRSGSRASAAAVPHSRGSRAELDRGGAVTRVRPAVAYALIAALGTAAFLYPFWVPQSALPNEAHNGDAPLVAALVGALVVSAIGLEVRNRT